MALESRKRVLGCAMVLGTLMPSSSALVPRQATSTAASLFSDTQTLTSQVAATTAPIPNPFGASASACWSSYIAYSSIKTSINSVIDNIPFTSASFFPTYTSTDCCYPWPAVASTTTLCDGYPRVLDPSTPVYNVTSYTTLTDFTLSTQGNVPSHTEVLPTCTVAPTASACTALWSAYQSTLVSLSSASDPCYETYSDQAHPPCPTPALACPSAATQCSVKLDDATFYYWPQTTTSGNFCARNGTTVTPSPTAPPAPDTTVIDGQTFTSPSVYIVASSAYAWYKTSGHGLISYGLACGHTSSSATWTVNPEKISTEDVHALGTYYPMDWEDMNTVRMEAYQRACGRRYGCSTFTDIVSRFDPLIVLPEAIRDDSVGWSGCDGESNFRPTFVELGAKPDAGAKAVKKLKAPASNVATSTLKNFDPQATGSHRNVKHVEFEEEVLVIVLDGQAAGDGEL